MSRSPSFLLLGDRPVAYADLRAADRPPATLAPALTPAEIAMLAFCRRWLRGARTFTLHTSGSTGEPQPVRLTRRRMTLSARLTGQALGLRPGDRALVCLNTQYIAGIMMLVRGLVLRLALTVVPPARRPLPPAGRFDFTALVPLQLQAIVDDAAALERLNGMRAVLIGGAPVSPALLAAVRERVTAPIYHTYGMTETVSHVALRRLNGAEADAAFVPLPGVTLGVDGRGCLVITSELAHGGRLVTNDVVDLLPDGRFHWLGRADNVINSGGVKVQAERVERALAALPPLAARRLFVAGVPDAALGERVTAFVEGEPVEGVAALLAATGALALYERPRAYCFVPRFAETPTGKIDRRAVVASAGCA